MQKQTSRNSIVQAGNQLFKVLLHWNFVRLAKLTGHPAALQKMRSRQLSKPPAGLSWQNTMCRRSHKVSQNLIGPQLLATEVATKKEAIKKLLHEIRPLFVHVEGNIARRGSQAYYYENMLHSSVTAFMLPWLYQVSNQLQCQECCSSENPNEFSMRSIWPINKQPGKPVLAPYPAITVSSHKTVGIQVLLSGHNASNLWM